MGYTQIAAGARAGELHAPLDAGPVGSLGPRLGTRKSLATALDAKFQVALGRGGVGCSAHPTVARVAQCAACGAGFEESKPC